MTQHRGVAVAVAAAVALQPFNPYNLVGPVSVADFGLIGALGVVGAHQVLTDDGFLAAGVRPLSILFGALILWLVIAAGGWHVTQFIGFGLTILLVGLFARSDAHVETLLWGALAGATVASLLTMYSATLDPAFGGRAIRSRLPPPLDFARTTGIPVGSFGAFSTYLLAPLPFSIVRWVRTRRHWLLVPIGVVTIAVILLQTRATYLAFAVGMGVLAAGLFGRLAWEAGWRNAGASLLGLGTSALVMAGAAWILFTINVANAVSRVAQFVRAAELIAANPLTGVTPPVLRYFPVLENIPHNVVLLVGTVGGLPAVALLFAIFATAVAGLWRAGHDTLRVQDCSIAVAAGFAATLTNLSLAPGFTRAFWLLIGLGSVFVFVRDGQVGMARWYRVALSNSRTGSALRRRQNSVVADWLTADATGTRENVEAAWAHSTCRQVIIRLRNAAQNSTAIRVLIGKGSE